MAQYKYMPQRLSLSQQQQETHLNLLDLDEFIVEQGLLLNIT